MPGLVQTEGYARALLAGGGLFAPDEVEQQVTTRLDRQGLLTRDRPPLLSVVVDEHVLRRRIGGPEVMREQIAAPRETRLGVPKGPNPRGANRPSVPTLGSGGHL